MRKKAPLALIGGLAAVLLVLLAVVVGRLREQPRWNRAGDLDSIRELIQPPPGAGARYGIAAAVLLDTSGSMNDPVPAVGGGTRPKIEIAREVAVDLVRQFAEFAARHPDRVVQVGVYEFSTREDQPPSRRVLRLGSPDPEAVREAIRSVTAEGATPIGDAMVAAKQDLDATGTSERHILVITDGESNRGFTPVDVTRVISEQPEDLRASIYFVAFDVDAVVFDSVREAGGLVLGAGNEADLRQTLDYILTGKILVEQPATPTRPL